MKKLKTTLEIGGTLNNSFSEAAQKAGSGIERVSQSIRAIELKQSKINQFGALKKQVDETASSYDANNAKLQSLKQEIEKTDKPSKQLIKDFKQTEKETQKLQKALLSKQERAKTLKKSLGDLADSESKLRRENAKLAVSMALSQKRMEALANISDADLKGKLGGLTRGLRNVSLGIAGMGAAAGAASFKLVKSVADDGDAIAKLATRVGIGTKSLQQWQYVAERSGVPVENLNSSLDMFNKRMGKARDGKGAMFAGLASSGKENLEILQELMNTSSNEDALNLIMERASKMRENERAKLMDAVFGSQKMGSIATQSFEEIEKLKKEKLSLGFISEKTAKLSEDFGDTLTNVNHAAAGLKSTLAEELLPTFIKLGKKLTGFLTGQGDTIQKWAVSLGKKIEDAVPRIISFSREFTKSIHSIITPIQKTVSLFGGWQTVAYTLGSVLAGKMLLSVISFARAVVTTTIAVRTLAITSLPSAIASIASFSTALFASASTAIPAVIAGIRGMSLALVSSPIGLAIAGIATGATLIYANWEKLVGLFESIKKAFLGVVNVAKKLGLGLFRRLFGGKQDEPANDSVKPNGTKTHAKVKSMARAAAISAPLMATPAMAAPALQTPPKMPTIKQQSSKPAKVTQHITISMQTQSHQNHEQIADLVIEQLEQKQAQLNRGAFHD